MISHRRKNSVKALMAHTNIITLSRSFSLGTICTARIRCHCCILHLQEQTQDTTEGPPSDTAMVNDQNIPEDATVQLPEAKVMASESSTMSGPVVGAALGGHRRGVVARRKAEVMQVALRLLCMVSSVIALSFMVTAKEASTLSIFGFHLLVYSKWSFSESFEYLVGVSGAVVVHSLLQLLIGTSRLLRKSSVIPSRNHAWLILAGDQAFAYVLMSTGSAASGVTNLNHAGIRHTALPNFCKPLHKFCDRVGISIAFTFISCFLLATSAIQDVIWLSKH